MGQVSVTLNNRTYRLACNDGEEERLATLVSDVKARVEALTREFGQTADERILLMAAVLLADELMDLREAHEAVLAAAAEVLRDAAAVPAAETGKSGQGRQQAGKSESGKSEPAKAAKPSAERADSGKSDGRDDQPSAVAGHPALPSQTGRTKPTAA